MATEPKVLGNRLQGKVAIVTGGGSGFGQAICKRFAEEGCKVIVADMEYVFLLSRCVSVLISNVISFRHNLSRCVITFPLRGLPASDPNALGNFKILILILLIVPLVGRESPTPPIHIPCISLRQM